MNKHIALLISLIFFTLTIAAQSTGSAFRISGSVKVDQGVVDGFNVEIYKDGTLERTESVNRSGNFSVELELNHYYRFSFVKSEYYTKQIDVDTHVPPEVCRVNCEFPPYQLSIKLFKRIPGVPYEEKVAGVIGYNKQIDNFDVLGSTNPALYKQEVTQLVKENRSRSARLQAEIDNLNQRKYDDAIRDADGLFNVKKYKDAMNRYRDAVLINENEDYPRKRVNACYEIIVAEQIKSSIGIPSEETLIPLVEHGDQMMKKYEYSVAKVAYEMALSTGTENENIKKKYESALAEVKKLEELGKTEREHNASVYEQRVKKYNELIDQGDAALKELEFSKAQHYYSMAATQIEENSYTRMILKKVQEMLNNEISSLEKAITRENETKTELRSLQETAYLNAIAEADQLFEAKDYNKSLSKYQEASKIKTFEMYPKDQIRKVKEILNDIKLRGEKYNDLMAKAKSFFTNGIFDSAIEAYEAAHDLIPSENEALAKIEEVRMAKRELKYKADLKAQYAEAIKNGDRRFNKQDYINAIKFYEEAVALKPDEDYPLTQIERSNIEIKVLDGLKKEQEQYDEFIVEADQLMNRNQYEYAKDFYERASKIKPNEKYPKSQLEKIVLSIENKRHQEEVNEKYTNFIASADDEYMANKYNEAIKIYQQAEMVKPQESYPKLQIERIQNIITEIAKQEQLDMQYKNVIALADGQFNNEDYDVAEVTYRKAQNIKPNEKYPKTQIQKIVEIRKELTKQRLLEQNFADFLAKGDEYKASNDYDMAVVSYNQALEIKPEDSEVLQKIEVVNELIRKKEEIRIANRKYETLIKFGDQLFKEGDYEEAINSFESALEIKPLEMYPREQITIIKDKIRKIEELNQSYALQLKLADEHFQNKSYSSAIASYEKAQTIKPNDTYPAIQIEKIKSFVREKQAKERTEAQYNLHISEGDSFIENEKYNEAISAYQDALALKSGEEYPREQILIARNKISKLEQDNINKQYETTLSLADQLLKNKEYDAAVEAYQAAIDLKPDNDYSMRQIQQINEIRRRAKIKDEEYNLYIQQADNYYNSSKYNQAVAAYRKAHEIKTNQTYPLQQIRKINNLLTQKDHVSREFVDVQNTYAEVVQKGDTHYRKTEYEEARAYYQHASYLMPDKAYPKQQIGKINSVGSLNVGNDVRQVFENVDLSDIKNIPNTQRNEAYKEAQVLANKFMGLKEFQLAKFYYSNALLLDPENSIANSIVEIDELAKQRNIDINGYFNMVAKAEGAFDNEDFSVAEFYFNKAKEAKPNDQYVKDRLVLAVRMVKMSNRKEYQTEFNQSIQKGDAAFNNRNYSVARFFYRKALNLNVDNVVAQKKLSQVETVLGNLHKLNTNSEYQSLIEKGDRSVTLKRYSQAIDFYNQALKVIPEKEYPKQQIKRIKELLGR